MSKWASKEYFLSNISSSQPDGFYFDGSYKIKLTYTTDAVKQILSIAAYNQKLYIVNLFYVQPQICSAIHQRKKKPELVSSNRLPQQRTKTQVQNMFSSVQREAHFRGLQTFKKFILVPYISVILKVSGHRYNFINSRRTHRIYAATACQVASVVSDSVRPHGLQPTRLLRPWDSPGKNTGVGCHFLLQCMKSGK